MLKEKKSFSWFCSLYFPFFSLRYIRLDALVGLVWEFICVVKWTIAENICAQQNWKFLRTNFAKIYAQEACQRKFKFIRWTSKKEQKKVCCNLRFSSQIATGSKYFHRLIRATEFLASWPSPLHLMGTIVNTPLVGDRRFLKELFASYEQKKKQF